jgi:hypothetical protein
VVGPLFEGGALLDAVAGTIVHACDAAAVPFNMTEDRLNDMRLNPELTVHPRAAGSSKIVQPPSRHWIIDPCDLARGKDSSV